MAVFIPVAINLMKTDPDSVKRSNIGSPISVSTKTAGNLPLTGGASQYGNSSVGNLNGILWDMPSLNVSVETKLIVFCFQFNAPNRIQCNTVANQGIVVRIGSGSGSSNYKQFLMGGNDTPVASSQAGPVPMVIDLNDTSNESSSGNFNNTDVETYGHACRYLKLTGNSSSLIFFSRVHIFDTAKNAAGIVKFTGSSNFDDIITAVLGSSYTNKIGTWVQKLSSTYFIPIAFQIGDASTATTFNDNGVTVVSPSSADPGDPRYRLTTQGSRVYVSLRNNAADSALFSGTYVWGVASPWDLDVNNNSSIIIQGATFNGMGRFVLGNSVAGAAIFNLSSGAGVVSNGANIDGSVINGDLEITDNRDYSNITVNGDVRISTGANDSVTYTNFSWSGDLTNTGSNTLSITTAGSTSGTSSDIGTGAGKVNLITPSSKLTVAINQSSCDVVILAAGTNTILASVDAQAGTSFEFIYSGSFNVDIGVVKQGFVVNYIYSFLLTGIDATIPVTLLADRSYS